jgi:thiamine pyrophosphokinase
LNTKLRQLYVFEHQFFHEILGIRIQCMKTNFPVLATIFEYYFIALENEYSNTKYFNTFTNTSFFRSRQNLKKINKNANWNLKNENVTKKMENEI